jgi:hypothetical protein
MRIKLYQKINIFFFCLLLLLLSGISKTYAAGTITISTTGTWVAPSNTYSVTVEARGGGAAGSINGTHADDPGGGGGGGAFTKGTVPVTPGTSYTVTVAGAVGSGSGGVSRFIYLSGSQINANGGSTTTNRNGGAGGTAESIAGYVTASYAGGAGGTVAHSANTGGGGGGEGGGSTATGAAGSVNSGTAGGAGGTGGDGGDGGRGGNNNAAGSSGSSPGGGGGGAGGNNNVAGSGAAGRVYLSWNESPSVALNTTDGTTTPSTTPILLFTGTDVEGNDIRYNIQIDTVNTFNSGNLLNKVSNTDPGFALTGDTDPFTSGSQVSYTLQSALSAGTTYYWRVSGLDPTGSNTYGGWATTRTFVTPIGGYNLSGTIYQTDESSPYLCSTTGNLTVNLRVGGAGSYTAECTTDSGSWSIANVALDSGSTVYAYISGESVKGNTVLVATTAALTDLNITVNRVTLRDDVNALMTNAKIYAGNTVDADDLITFSGSNIIIASTYETHIYTEDAYEPKADVSTGKLHLVGSYSGNFETLTLTGSGTGTSRPLYINGGTFTAPSTTTFTGTSATAIESTTVNDLNLTPIISSTVPYTFVGDETINGNFNITPISSGTYPLTISLGGTLTVAPTKTTTISGGTQAVSIIDTGNGSNYSFNTGFLNIGAAGTLNARGSDITLTGTSGTIFTRTGTFTPGTGTIIFSQSTGNTTLTSGAITFYNLTINMAGKSGTLGNNIIVGNNLNIAAGTFAAAALTVDVGRNWTNSGTFTYGTSTVNLAGSGNQQVSGNTTFYNLSATAPSARTITFIDGSVTGIADNGSLTFQGASGNQLTLNSDTSGDWYLQVSPTGTSVSVTYVHVTHSNAAGYKQIDATGIGNTHHYPDNNTNWLFAASNVFNTTDFSGLDLSGLDIN